MTSSSKPDTTIDGLDEARCLKNIETLEEFDRKWQWSDRAAGAITAIMRVKNEAPNLPFVLPPLLRSVDKLVIVDNQSTDGTAALATRLAIKHGAHEKLTLVSYPFEVSRCGSDHRATPPASVRSLCYFYNWSFSHASTAYAAKWDGDMVVTVSGERILRALAWQLEGVQRIVSLSLYSLWIESRDTAYVDVERENHESRIWPNRRGIEFLKARNYETIRTLNLPRIALGPGSCFEIKRLSENEFLNWTHPNEFNSADSLAPRKRREWQVAKQLLAGAVPSGVVKVTATPGEHIIDTVRKMPNQWWADILGGR